MNEEDRGAGFGVGVRGDAGDEGGGGDGLGRGRGPEPRRSDRWQPLRCGLLNLYRYEDEEFRFEDGRLLLRGDNGTGKSRVLALQLPFLLDGDVSPSRVEPDGDPAKRIEWHLLMGRWPERTGYTWIEFGKKTEDGGEAYLTLGCGMRAVAGHSGLHSRWFFVTSRRVGVDLSLQNAERRPHGRERLEEAIAGDGRVFTESSEYRRAVDQALFGLGPRFDRLVELLIRLRRPKLSQKLDEEELSTTLSDALPVLPMSLIDEVAEAFRGLESDRDALRGFVETRQAVEEFLREYGVYVRIAARRRAGAVRSIHGQYEEAQRAVRDAERRVAQGEAQIATLVATVATLERDQAAAEEAARTLRASPEMQTVAELERAEQAARSAERAERDAQSDLNTARAAVARAREHLAQAELQHREIAAAVETQSRAVKAAAASAAMSRAYDEHLGDFSEDGAKWQSPDFVRRGEAAMERASRKQAGSVRHLRGREREVEEARRAWQTAEADRRRAIDAGVAAREAEHLAREGLEQAGAAFRSAYDFWRAALRLLPVNDGADAADLSVWIERREGMNPFRLHAQAIHRGTVEGLANRAADQRQVIVRESEIIDGLREELARIEQGKLEGPPVIPGRRSERSGRAGAPLWRLCDFRSDASESDRAGIEAALEASGLLDAWVLPDGRLVHPETEDTFLGAGGPEAFLEAGAHLGRWLVPAPDSTDPEQQNVSMASIENVLRQIGGGRDQGRHWISADGCWRLGPLSGRWTKASASFVGEGSRAGARRRRMEELRRELSRREAARSLGELELRRLEADLGVADAELADFPEDRPIVEAGVRLGIATAALVEAYAAQERAETAAADRKGIFGQAEAAFTNDLADLGLEEWRGRLEALDQALGEFGVRLAGLWPTLRHWQSSSARLELVRRQSDDADGAAAERVARHQAMAEAFAAAASRHETLRAMHGATVATVLARLAEVEGRISDLRQALQARRSEHTLQVAAKAAAESDGEHAKAERDRHDAGRQVAIESLGAFAENRLLAEADARLGSIEAAPWSVTRAVEVAREAESLLSETAADEATWRRRQDSIHVHIQELRDQLLARNHRPETHQFEDLLLVRCHFQARSHSMTELRDAFAAEVQERERLLEAREREVIENHLLGEVAVELQRLVRGAEEWIASANRELVARPTSTGLRFRFVWEVALEGAFGETRRSFLKTSELWSPAERSGITRFLQDRIRAEQAADEQASWRDHLGAALDYRRWHRFVVERQQEGTWRRLDRRTYGTGSGGEKALALTLPRFAAAAAHYRSARADAPRLVMLDEAFAGIDPTMRSQCMGMLAQFDLDVVMTSEQEWGCYPTVPGLAIHHLTARHGIDAVASTLWIWNGRERRRMAHAPPPSSGREDAANPGPLL
ncbi:MAG: TIGR02680 family protein [Limisphaerales bacterium]